MKKWVVLYNEHDTKIEVNYGTRENALPEYRVFVVEGRPKTFKGETAHHDMMRFACDHSPIEVRRDIVDVSISNKWW